MSTIFIPASDRAPFINWAARQSTNRADAQKLLRALLAFPQTPNCILEIEAAIAYFIHD